MSSEKIKQQALKCFSEYGYEGTSLSLIADNIGMKKQSIYSHFKSKEDIFISVLNSVLQEEEDFFKEYFEKKHSNIAESLNGFITLVKERFIRDKEYNIKFILRTSYMPPVQLSKTVSERCNSYFAMVETMVSQIISTSATNEQEIRKKTLAFLTILEGLFSALLYCGVDRYEEKQLACWELFLKNNI